MARVTVEDCVEKVTNRFELVMVASQRSREISAGAEPRVERDRDKNPVVALREIAEEKASPEELYNGLVQSLQRHVEVDEPEEDGFDAMASDPEFAGLAGTTGEPTIQPAGSRDIKVDDSDYDEEVPATDAEVEPLTAAEPPTAADEPPAVAEHPTVAYEDAEEDDSKG